MKYINRIKYFFEKPNNKKKFILFMTVIVSILIVAGTSFAYISFNMIGKNDSLISVGCLKYTISDFNNISIDDALTMTDKEGLNTVPYVYSITNTCTTEAYYETSIGIVNTSNNDNISKVKIALNGDTYVAPTLISSFNESVITDVDSDISNTYLIDDGYLKYGETKTFNLRMWVDYSVTSFSGSLDSKIIINSIAEEGPNFDSYTAGYKVFKTSLKVSKTDYNPNYSYIAPYTDSNNVYSQTSGLLEIISDSSKDYYFRGSPIDNYLSFAGMNWRIVKINNDGSLKLILEDDINLTSVYKSTSTEEDLNYGNSTLKSTLDTWYTSNLSSYDSYIKSEDYCLDSNAYNRNITNSNPDGITCSSSISSKIGGLTADDIAYAGGKYNTANTNYYLYKNYKWWTISYGNYSENAYEIIVDSNGSINTNILTDSLYVRPVITLSANAILSGSGTSSDKYTVTGLVTDEVLNIDTTAPTITFARATENRKIEVSASDDTAVAGIYISTSNTTPEATDSNWITYSKEKYISDVYDKGIYYIWVKDKNNNISSVKSVVVGNIYIYDEVKNQVNTSITPNFNYISNYNTNNINTNDNGVFLYNGTDDNGGNKNIYYYRGNVTNNNVLFGGYCWKIIRTTSTGGTKLIYNGTPKTEYTNLQKLEQSDYLNLTNNSSSPYTFDTSTKKWTSGSVANSSSSEISFTVTGSDTYILEYDVSSEGNFDRVYIYKDGTNIKTVSGIDDGQIDLGTLTSSNVIKIKYSKNSGAVVGRDNIIFSLNKKSNTSTSYTTCDNSGEESQIAKTSYNSSYTSPSDVGYMYGERYTYSSKAMTSITDAYVYGNDVTYSGGTYTLTNTVTSIGSNWRTERSTLANGKHYTCFTTEKACSTVYYITYFGNKTTAYYLTFTDGDTLDTAKEKMYTNTNNSTIKTVLDNWYSTNLTNYSSYLENTIFCNERTLYSGPLYSKDANSTGVSYYKTVQRLPGSPSLTCLNNNDKFSLSTSSGGTKNYGNNALTYPIGLITADELSIAGGRSGQTNNNFYLYNGVTAWSLSPYDWDTVNSVGFYLRSTGFLYLDYVNDSYGARGVVSLKLGTTITSGDGSYTDPYTIG